MNRICFLFLLLIFFAKVCLAQTPSGTFSRHTKGGGFRVELNPKGTYNQRMSDCTWGFKTKGSWVLYQDTVYLRATKMYNRDGKKMKPDSTSARWNSYRSMNKFVYRNDTLFLVINGKPKYPLLRQEEKK